MKKSALLLLALLTALSASAQNYDAKWESLDKRPTPDWFQDAKFGIFVHWGLYAVPSWAPSAHENANGSLCYSEHYWSRLGHFEEFDNFHNKVYGENFSYRDFVKDFKAEMFKPEDWADIFAGSGAKYVVLTSKHHDGFCLWPSRYSPNWNAKDVGPHRDLLGDLSKAVKDKGLKMGYYYSLLEWFHPFYNRRSVDKYVKEHMLPQMKELVTRYRPDIVWPDGEWDYPSSVLRSEEFLQWLFNDSSVKDKVVVNDRWGKECRSKHGGFYTTEYGLVFGDEGLSGEYHPWEECRGVGDSFGFNRNENLSDYETSEQLVHLLVKTVAAGGNLLLNVGPTADGRIPLLFQQRLKDMGDWLKVNSEAIYGSRKWFDAPESEDLFFTSKDGAIYVIMTKWQDKPITVNLPFKASKVEMLGSDKKVQFSKSGNKVTISPLKISKPSDIPCDYAWVYKIS